MLDRRLWPNQGDHLPLVRTVEVIARRLIGGGSFSNTRIKATGSHKHQC